MSERLGDLTPRERELVDVAAVGDVLECSQLSIEQLSATDDPERTIRAELLRELLLKRCDKPPDPRGVRLHGARIAGTLDLTHVETAVGMELRGCSFDHPVLLEDAHLPWLTLTGSCVPALAGNGLQVEGDLPRRPRRPPTGAQDRTNYKITINKVSTVSGDCQELLDPSPGGIP